MKVEFRLLNAPAAPGRMGASELSQISWALHQLSIRLGREQVQVRGPGRSRRSVEDLSRVTLGLSSGSTVLTAEVGPSDMLPVEFEDTAARDQQLTAILEAMADDTRPVGVPDLIADSIAELVQGLRLAAPEIEMTLGDRSRRFPSQSLHRETWRTPRRSVDADSATVSGRLEKVDIHSHELRIRDDVGNTLALSEVAEDVATASLIGHRVRAVGLAVHDRDGRLVGVQGPRVTAFESVIPPADVGDLSQAWASLPGPDPEGAVELGDEEFDSFMEAIGR